MTAIVLALVTFSIWIAFEFRYLPIRSFDSENWREAPQASNSPRLHMVDSLIASGRLDGLSREDVLALLGSPTDTSYFSDWDAVYWLGQERGLLSLDSEWLVIRFDGTGQVLEYRLVRD